MRFTVDSDGPGRVIDRRNQPNNRRGPKPPPKGTGTYKFPKGRYSETGAMKVLGMESFKKWGGSSVTKNPGMPKSYKVPDRKHAGRPRPR